MYWNNDDDRSVCDYVWINRNMRCIEIALEPETWEKVLKINRNMRCIEITLNDLQKNSNNWLIETWDVLKSYTVSTRPPYGRKINRNMRCIEITVFVDILGLRIRLIETWDVLKYICGNAGHRPRWINRNMRCIEISGHDANKDVAIGLIETWDVLKLTQTEILLYMNAWLIETWDVLKFKPFCKP